ncbi:redox-sensing transcriptional repressor Rex [Treponema zioleckii]|uniref:redox-sensing transcriptional repressor Rex n=1 Tax=Treponema zioleckii TaxID=331680 RepID=UPI00168BE7C3|nr:redox-sensing transcriptional repressor Rex [Treponema zioleckii]
MKSIPSPSKRRLVTLSQLLAQTESKNGKITSVEISQKTGWSDATVRRDISLLELHSGKSNGYYIEELRSAICEKLNISAPKNTLHKCCIVGLGKIGEALLEKSIYEKSNFKLSAGFDPSMNKIEILKTHIPLYSTAELETVMKLEHLEFAILAVPDEKAQSTAEKLAAIGIKGIVNYTNVILSLPENVVVENANPLTALTNLLSNCGEE